jgi:hypothetical protein
MTEDTYTYIPKDQGMSRQFANCEDWWNLSMALGAWLRPRIKMFLDHHNGTPFEFIPNGLDCTDEEAETGHAAYDDVLRKIHVAADLMEHEMDWLDDPAVRDKNIKLVEEGLIELAAHWKSLSD